MGGAGEAFVEAETGETVCAVTVEQPVGDGNALINFGLAEQHGVVLHECMLVGGDEPPC